jgi:hypothetical protein
MCASRSQTGILTTLSFGFLHCAVIKCTDVSEEHTAFDFRELDWFKWMLK